MFNVQCSMFNVQCSMFDQLLSQLAAITWVDWLGMATGVLGVWLSIKERIAAWPFFIVCYACYVSISYQSGLYAFMGMNTVFIGISLYGLWAWARGQAEAGAALSITATRRGHWPLVVGILLLATFWIGWLLDFKDNSNLPYVDALAACSGFIAQWMLSRKQIETWMFWILSDLIYIGIFLKGGYWPGVLLFTAFIFLALKGWREWRSLLQASPHA